MQKDAKQGILGQEFEAEKLEGVQACAKEAESDARDEVWATCRYVLLLDQGEIDGCKVIDLGAGHASRCETVRDRVVSGLRSEAFLNQSVGARYSNRQWPVALEAAAAWPLTGLRQAFLNSSLTRLIDPDRILTGKTSKFVDAGKFGLASGPNPHGINEQVSFDVDSASEG